MQNSSGKRAGLLSRPWLFACCISLATLVLSLAILFKDRLDRQDTARQFALVEARYLADLVAARLQIAKLTVSVLGDLPVRQIGSQTGFEDLVGNLFDVSGAGLTLQWAPRAVVSLVHPLTGNEGALGHDLLADPLRRDAVERSIRTATGHWAGPFKLMQGGIGLLYRLPLYHDLHRQTPESFSGLAIGLLKFPQALPALDEVLAQTRAAGHRLIARVALSAGQSDLVQVWGPEPVAPADSRLRVQVLRGFPEASTVNLKAVAADSEQLLISVTVDTVDPELTGYSVPMLAAAIVLAVLLGALGFAVSSWRVGELALQKSMRESRDQSEVQARALSKANAELAQRTAEAEAANRTKSEFLSTMSHELRTPLNAVIGYAHILARSGLDSQRASHVSQILSSGKHLLAMISDVLDLNRIEAGQLQLDEQEFSLRELVAEVESMLGEQARRKGLVLTSDLTGSGDRFVGDPMRLKQCLLNYAANALKFTEQGKVQILVQAGPCGDDAHALLRFEVQDTGPGIAPEQQDKLFASFSQVDMTSVRKHGGAGMGLSITRRLALAMGGDVGVSSEPGVGSKFWFSARVGCEQAMADAGEPPAADLPADARLREKFGGIRALVVDDDPIGLGMLQVLLSRLGWQVDAAESGAQALARARGSVYGLVLMDIQMPGMTGIEAVTQIRRLPGWSSVPVVALSADTRPENREQCLAAGMDTFLGKPVDPDTMYRAILDSLEHRSAVAAQPADSESGDLRPDSA